MIRRRRYVIIDPDAERELVHEHRQSRPHLATPQTPIPTGSADDNLLLTISGLNMEVVIREKDGNITIHQLQHGCVVPERMRVPESQSSQLGSISYGMNKDLGPMSVDMTITASNGERVMHWIKSPGGSYYFLAADMSTHTKLKPHEAILGPAPSHS